MLSRLLVVLFGIAAGVLSSNAIDINRHTIRPNILSYDLSKTRPITKKAPSNKLFLWKLNGEKSTVYLLGSIHALKRTHYPLKELYDYAYELSEQIVVESNNISEEAILDKMTLKNNKLYDYISDDSKIWINNFLLDNDLRKDTFDNIKPAFVNSILQEVFIDSSDYKFKFGVDNYYIDKAENNLKKIHTLEGIERYDNIFPKSLLKQGKELDIFISEYNEDLLNKSINNLGNAWINLDHSKFTELVNLKERNNLDEYNRVLRDRNNAWLPKIISHINTPNKITLIIAGAAHFFGNDSLLKLLQEKGYRCEQIYDVNIPEISFVDAIKENQINTIKQYLHFHPNLNISLRQDSDLERKPIHIAAMEGTIDAINILIDKGSNVDVLDYQNCTPFFRACELGKVNVAKHLLSVGANINLPNNEYNTPIHIAAQRGSINTLKFLIENGASVDSRNASDKWTPLHNAVYGSKLNSINILIDNNANINLKTTDGNTALHMAVLKNRLEAAKLLLKLGADKTAKNNKRLTAEELAILNQNKEMRDLFIQETHPTISLDLTNKVFLTFETVELKVNAEGNKLNYKWFKDNRLIENKDSSKLILSNIQKTDAGKYHVVVSNSVGSVKSSVANVVHLLDISPPKIIAQPRNISFLKGDVFSLKVHAEGLNLEYIWYKDGKRIYQPNSNRLSFTDGLDSWDSGEYYVIVKNEGGSTRSNIATLDYRGTNRLIWKYKADNAISESPALSKDQNSLFISSGSKVISVNSVTGNENWAGQTYQNIYSSPIVADNNMVYVVSRDALALVPESKLYAFDILSGKIIWVKNIAWVYSSPAISKDGTLFYGTTTGNISAVNGDDGHTIWESEVDSFISSEISITSDSIYFGSRDNKVFSLDKNTGEKKWEFIGNGSFYWSSAAIGSEDRIYIGNRGKTLYSINSLNGEKIWEFETIGLIDTSPVIGRDGILFINTTYNLYCLDKTGNKKWDRKFSEKTLSSPIVNSDNIIYLTSNSNISAIDGDTGDICWEYNTGGDSKRGSPIIGANGNLYLNANNHILALKTNSSGLANSSWPMLGQNPQRTGSVEMFSNSPALTITKTINQRIPYKFSITTLDGLNYEFQASSDLKKWSKLQEVKGTGNEVEVSDQRKAIFQQQYYRVRLVD